MRKYLTAEVNKHETIFSQMGAKVHVMNSLLCYVSFNIDGTEVSYVYNVNKKNKYFLERIEPYPEPAGTFKSVDDLVETIKIDIEQFKNAKNSNIFPKFVEINKRLSNSIRSFEDLYLYYNVPRESIKKIIKNLEEIEETIKTTKKNSTRLYFKKNPDTL